MSEDETQVRLWRCPECGRIAAPPAPPERMVEALRGLRHLTYSEIVHCSCAGPDERPVVMERITE